MQPLYDRNGLMFWTEREIRIRQMMVDWFVGELQSSLRRQNKAFEFLQVEAPILTPLDKINPNYSPDDYFASGDLVLRPETTMGSYRYAEWLLEHGEMKTRMPLCIWQHGKSFRKEQDQVVKNMRLKEFYQLEFQCIYGVTTANDYSVAIIPAVKAMIEAMIGPCRTEASDRLPAYSESTTDILCEANEMEVCSISKRTDFPNAKVLEVAIGSDRCVYNFLSKLA